MGIMDQINNMVQTANETAMKINELQNQGYKKVSAKKFDYHTELSDSERECLRKYQKSSIGSLIPMLLFAAFFVGIFVVAFMNTSGDDKESILPMIMMGVIFGAIALLMVIMPLLSVVGKKSACQATVVGKRIHTTRSSKGRTHTHFYAIAYQSSPAKVFSSEIPVSRRLFDELYEGDTITIIKSPVDCKAFKPY